MGGPGGAAVVIVRPLKVPDIPVLSEIT